MDFALTKIYELWDTPTNLDKKMKDLKRKLEELNALKGDTDSKMSIELRPRKKRKKVVELWFKNVERINGEIQDLGQKIEESSFFSRGFLKGDVLKKIQDVDDLFRRGKFHDGLVVDDPGCIGQNLPMTTLLGGAAQTCMEEILACLMGADVQKIGVWGMGGVGKTTIMMHINNQLLKETEKFNKVIWVTVSREMSISELRNSIARAMDVPLHGDETINAGRVNDMLVQKGKFVLILDDVWKEFTLEEVGIPEPSNGSKLVITTRMRTVCCLLGCREVSVSTLSKPDAWRLFSETLGQNFLNRLDILHYAEVVAEECDGLPLALVTIAGSMRDDLGEHNIHEWRNALGELKGHVQSVNDIEEKVFRRLQFSYDRLRDEKVQHCFLCCALYPEDWEIDTDELINLWIAEGLVDEMGSMQADIDRGYTILKKLKNCCLIENTNVSGSRVKLHDVVRDMASRITKRRFLVRAGMQLKRIPDVEDWNEDLEKASLIWNTLQIPSQMPPPKCQKLTTLLLSRCFVQSIPECFFEQMHGLKILDLSDNPIKSLPNSISNLETLTTLLLGRCEELETMPSFSRLQALRKLDLGGTKIKHMPHGMEMLENLKYLDLSCTQITEMADGIFAKLTSLQHLAAYGADSCDQFFVRGEEIGGLRKLEVFEGCLSDWNEWNSCAQGLHAQERWPRQYIIYVGHQSDQEDYYGDSKKFIELRGCDMVCTIGIKILSDVEVLNIRECSVNLCEEESLFSWFIPMSHNNFSSLSRIDIEGCRNIKKLFSSNWLLHNLQNLNTLKVSECRNMEEIIASESEVEGAGNGIAIKLTLPRLKKLELWLLPELKSICGANGVMVCDSIELINISGCPDLKRIPLNLPLQDDGQPSPPSSLRRIIANTEWWESVEWDHPHARSLLEPYVTTTAVTFFFDPMPDHNVFLGT